MILGIWSNIWEKMNEVAEIVKEWIITNTTNPVVWISFFFIGIFIFFATYRALHKD